MLIKKHYFRDKNNLVCKSTNLSRISPSSFSSCALEDFKASSSICSGSEAIIAS